MQKTKISSSIGVTAILALLVAAQSVFIVDQTQRAIVLQLGKPVGKDLGPGLHFKLPFVQNAVLFDQRLLEYDTPSAEILTKDKKNLVVDNYCRWRIANPLLFYQTLRDIPRGESRLDDIVYAELRVALGRYTLTEVVSTERGQIMEQVAQKCNMLLKDYGIEVVDVRIKRTDLPPENQRAIFGRMNAERERQAKKYRSEGREEAAKIRATADKERTIMLAEANQKAEIIKGTGEAKSTAVYAAAFSKDLAFYAFLRSMNAYKKVLAEKTSVVFSPKSEFLEYMDKSTR